MGTSASTAKEKAVIQTSATCNNGTSKKTVVGNSVTESLQKLTAGPGVGSPRLSTKLPLKDKRITIEGSRRLLLRASTNALSTLNGAERQLPGLDELAHFEFPFQNGVFEGGGVKGIAYVGAVKCLEDAGIKLKRFAGSSIGSTVAGLLSVGYTADELIALYVQDLSGFIRDSRCELLCFLPRLIVNLGLNPGKAFYDWYGRCLAVKTDNPDITFRQIYDRFGTELCVVVLNMNTGREEYFHPKTTPNLKVRTAIRMSISVPGVLEPVQLQHLDGQCDMYIDGGVICNYPIFVFDGWWLSMEPQHQIYNKLPKNGSCSCPESSHLVTLCDPRSRFATRNSKTLGFKQTMNSGFFNDTLILPTKENYADLQSAKKAVSARPSTKLAKKRMKYLVRQEKNAQLKSRQLEALSKFFELLQKCTDSHGNISRYKLCNMFVEAENGLSDDHLALLFGDNVSRYHIISELPNQEMLAPADFDQHMRRIGLDMNHLLESSAVLRNDNMTGAKSFWSVLQGNVTNAARRSYVKPEDIDRTVNIHTDYIEFLDFEICSKDKEFLVQQGYKHTLTFLQRYVTRHRKKSASSPEFWETDMPHEKVEEQITHDIDDDNDSGTVTEPIFYIDDDESYEKWLCSLKCDNAEE